MSGWLPEGEEVPFVQGLFRNIHARNDLAESSVSYLTSASSFNRHQIERIASLMAQGAASNPQALQGMLASLGRDVAEAGPFDAYHAARSRSTDSHQQVHEAALEAVGLSHVGPEGVATGGVDPSDIGEGGLRIRGGLNESRSVDEYGRVQIHSFAKGNRRWLNEEATREAQQRELMIRLQKIEEAKRKDYARAYSEHPETLASEYAGIDMTLSAEEMLLVHPRSDRQELLARAAIGGYGEEGDFYQWSNLPEGYYQTTIPGGTVQQPSQALLKALNPKAPRQGTQVRRKDGTFGPSFFKLGEDVLDKLGKAAREMLVANYHEKVENTRASHSTETGWLRKAVEEGENISKAREDGTFSIDFDLADVGRRPLRGREKEDDRLNPRFYGPLVFQGRPGIVARSGAMTFHTDSGWAHTPIVGPAEAKSILFSDSQIEELNVQLVGFVEEGLTKRKDREEE